MLIKTNKSECDGGSTNNTSKIILDLCGGSGSWVSEYVKNGYDLRSITPPAFAKAFFEVNQ